MKKEPVITIITGNKLQAHEDVLREAGNKLKEKGIDLKNLEGEMIFVETFRNFEIRAADFPEYPLDIPDCGMGTGKLGLGKGCIRIAKATIRIIA